MLREISRTDLSIGDNEVMIGSGDQIEPGKLSSQQKAAIGLPASLFKRIDDQANVGAFFVFYETPILFPVGGELTDRSSLSRKNVVGSHVLAATVGPGINFLSLDEPITIVLRLQVTERGVSRF